MFVYRYLIAIRGLKADHRGSYLLSLPIPDRGSKNCFPSPQVASLPLSFEDVRFGLPGGENIDDGRRGTIESGEIF